MVFINIIKGCAAIVRKCIEKKTGELMAVKIFRTDDEEKMNAAKEEYSLQKVLMHPNILEVKELFIDDMRNTLYTVMECLNGS